MDKSNTTDLSRDLRGTVQSVAKMRNVSTKTVRKWISKEMIYAERIGDRIIRIDLNSVPNIGTPMTSENSGGFDA